MITEPNCCYHLQVIFSKDQLVELKKSYERGDNLTRMIAAWGLPINFEVISIIYELQSGTYTKYATENSNFLDLRCDEIASILRPYLNEDSILLDCGTGEGTTYIPLLKKLRIKMGFGIDSSISRLTYAKKNASISGIGLNLAAANIAKLPCPTKSVDAVLTIHALEPNGGEEVPLLTELGRVARKFLFLVEPDFQRAHEAQKQRMKSLNYIRNLEQTIDSCGFQLLEKIPIKNNSNLENKASMFVVDCSSGEKLTSEDHPKTKLKWVDPLFHEQLTEYEGGMTNHFGLWFPVIRGIPLLRESDTQYLLAPAP